MILEGSAAANVNITNKAFNRPTVFDFSNVTMGEYVVHVDDCTNIVLYGIENDLNLVDDHCIKLDNCHKTIIYDCHTLKGQNGVKITNGSSETFVYKSTSYLASIDGMQCHALSGGNGPAGNLNVFHSCGASGDEEGFDITSSGQDQYVINCSGYSTGSSNALFVGVGASCNIINFSAPDYKILIKDCEYVNLQGNNISQVALRTQLSNGEIPKNVKHYGPNPPTIANIEGFDLDSIYSESDNLLPIPIQSWIDSRIEFIESTFN